MENSKKVTNIMNINQNSSPLSDSKPMSSLSRLKLNNPIGEIKDMSPRFSKNDSIKIEILSNSDIPFKSKKDIINFCLEHYAKMYDYIFSDNYNLVARDSDGYDIVLSNHGGSKKEGALSESLRIRQTVTQHYFLKEFSKKAKTPESTLLREALRFIYYLFYLKDLDPEVTLIIFKKGEDVGSEVPFPLDQVV